jgi:multicomponent Na+:H+ antiporter subunit F
MNQALDILLLGAMIFLVIAIIISFIRLIQGVSMWDRILMLNIMSTKVILFMAVLSIYLKSVMLMDIAISYGIIGFLTMTLLSKFILAGGKEK